MSQTNGIILRFEEKRAKEFEALFEREIMPLWQKFKREGKFLSASLTPVQNGNQGKTGVRDYILYVKVPSMKEHVEFDSSPDFNKFLPKAQAMQPEEPMVFLGETLFEI